MADAGTTFREHHPAVYRYLVHLTGDPELAADAAQEAFARLLVQRPSPEHPKAWVFRVATNLVREAGRTRGRRLRLLESAPEQTGAGDRPPSPEREAERGEAVARVREALAALPERDRTLLLMRHEGFRHREIAEAVGTTTGSVGTMIARALERLSAQLEPDGVQGSGSEGGRG